MTSLRSKFLVVLFSLAALFALASPASAAKSKHRHRHGKGTHGSHAAAHHGKRSRKHTA